MAEGPGAATRFLCLDVGSVRVGVALSDPTGTFAQPLAVLARWPKAGQPTVAERLSAWAREHDVGSLVVGRPLRLSGEAGPAALAAEAFVATLAPHLPLEIIWWDERLSTREAERALIAGGLRRRARRDEVDRVAAALILQGFLDARLTRRRRDAQALAAAARPPDLRPTA